MKIMEAVVRIADKGKSSYLRSPLLRLFPLEILGDVKKEPESFTEDVTSVLKEGNPEPVQADYGDSIGSSSRQRKEETTDQCL